MINVSLLCTWLQQTHIDHEPVSPREDHEHLWLSAGSAWLADTARKEFTIRAGLAAVSGFEHEHGAFTDAEMADAADRGERQMWARHRALLVRRYIRHRRRVCCRGSAAPPRPGGQLRRRRTPVDRIGGIRAY
jgi:hypothetical protein